MLKLAVMLMLVGVVGSLFSALFFLVRDRGNRQRTVRALSLRVGFSLALFVLLLFALGAGRISGGGQ